MKYQNDSGFTLIEVMIAAVILFVALSFTAEIYSSSSLTSEKAIEVANRNQSIPIVMDTIKTQLRHKARNKTLNEHSGTVLVNGVSFEWQAKRESYDARALQLTDITAPRPQFSLFNITVQINQEGNSKELTQFKVATW